MNKKIITFGIIALAVLLIGILLLGNYAITGNAVFLDLGDNEFGFNRSYTKAFCNGNECRDYEIVCLGDEVVRQDVVSGTVVFPDNWEDLREEKELCSN